MTAEQRGVEVAKWLAGHPKADVAKAIELAVLAAERDMVNRCAQIAIDMAPGHENWTPTSTLLCRRISDAIKGIEL